MSINQIIENTIGKEGGYSNHPADRGGPTKWGITQRVARANGYNGSMKELPRTTAVQIYYKEYAVKPGFDKVAAINEKIAEELFDTGVNMGTSIPALWLQEWLNALNDRERLYKDIAEDGDIGPATLKALKTYLSLRGDAGIRVLLTALNCSQGERYKLLARKRTQNEAFVFGWLRTRVGL